MPTQSWEEVPLGKTNEITYVGGPWKIKSFKNWSLSYVKCENKVTAIQHEQALSCTAQLICQNNLMNNGLLHFKTAAAYLSIFRQISVMESLLAVFLLWLRAVPFHTVRTTISWISLNESE